MATMLNGAAVMDAALLLIAANEPCPQPQTSEHLAAVEIMKLKHMIILQNKIDLVKRASALEQQQQILDFVKGTVAEGAPVVPISAQLRYNIDVRSLLTALSAHRSLLTVCMCVFVCLSVCCQVLVEYMINRIPVPVRNFKDSPKMIIIRSFDVNKPGAAIDDLKGGVAGGSILQGVLKVLL